MFFFILIFFGLFFLEIYLSNRNNEYLDFKYKLDILINSIKNKISKKKNYNKKDFYSLIFDINNKNIFPDYNFLNYSLLVKNEKNKNNFFYFENKTKKSLELNDNNIINFETDFISLYYNLEKKNNFFFFNLKFDFENKLGYNIIKYKSDILLYKENTISSKILLIFFLFFSISNIIYNITKLIKKKKKIIF